MPHPTHETDFIVIGGGVAGLAAARELAKSRLNVRLLEARPRLGGRIDTRRPSGWDQPVELGAEFIHVGNADLWRVVRSAGIKVRKLPDSHWLSQEGGLQKIPDLDRRLGRVMRLITPRQAGDQSFGAFFRRHPAPVNPEDWLLARSFVEGFEAAPQDRISARSLAGETMDEEHQYVLPGGYDQVVHALARDCERLGVKMSTRAVVRSVRWRRGHVEVTARNSARGECRHVARGVIVALPVGVLQARRGAGAVRFSPPLKRSQAWIDRLQMGEVVRLVMHFESKAWARLIGKIDPSARRRHGLGFIHSNLPGVPVWWALSKRPILVGWAGGPAARALLKLAPAQRRRRALQSLAKILEVEPRALRQALIGSMTGDWTNEPFTRGAYTFTVAGEDDTPRKLSAPVQGTICFAGEALADGAEIGTVHGALSSGIKAARRLVRASGPRSRR